MNFPPLNSFEPDSDIKHDRMDRIENCVAGLNHLMIISKPMTSQLSFEQLEVVQGDIWATRRLREKFYIKFCEKGTLESSLMRTHVVLMQDEFCISTRHMQTHDSNLSTKKHYVHRLLYIFVVSLLQIIRILVPPYSYEYFVSVAMT